MPEERPARFALVGGNGNADTVRTDGIRVTGMAPDLTSHAPSATLDHTVTGPEFDGWDHTAMDAYTDETKGGVRRGGTLTLATTADVSTAPGRERVVAVPDLVADEPGGRP